MLNKIRKEFNNLVSGKVNAAEIQKEPEMTKPVEQAAQFNATEILANLQAAEATLATQAGVLAELQAQFAAVSAELATVKAAKEKMEADAKSAKMSARKEKIVAAVGTDKSEALFTATESLADEQFEAVVGAMSANIDKEAASPAFTEQGVGHSADASKVVAEAEQSTIEAKLRAKYAQQESK